MNQTEQTVPNTAEASPSSNGFVRKRDNYRVVSDEYIESLFKGTSFGEPVDSDITAKRMLIAKHLRSQLDGYWSGHTIYWIMVDGGFLYDQKNHSETIENKTLTALGKAYLEEVNGTN